MKSRVIYIMMETHQRPKKFKRFMTYSCLLLLGLAAITALLFSPLSPTHADTSQAVWDGNFVTYTVGDLVSYNGTLYTCLQSHTSEPNWSPVEAPSLWQRQSSTPSLDHTSQAVWDGNFVTYSVGDLVSYNGTIYTCLQSHTSEPNWSPVEAPSLWQSSSASIINTATQPTQEPTNTTVPVTQPIQEPTNTVIPTTQPGTTTDLPIVPTNQKISVSVTFYTDLGSMADGNQTHIGACAVWIGQFPFGTVFDLYDPNDPSQVVYHCTAEDTGTHICQNNVDVALPGQIDQAIQLGVKTMLLQVVGFNSTVAQQAKDNHPSSLGCELGPTH